MDRSAPGPMQNLNRREDARKTELLTHSHASVAESIVDAVVMKSANLVFVSRPNGEVPVTEGHGFGLYYIDCRFLNGYAIEVGGERLGSLANVPVSGNEMLVQLANADPLEQGGHRIEAQALTLKWRRRLDGENLTLHDTLTFENFGRDRIRVPLDLNFRAHFEDIFVIRGLIKKSPGKLHAAIWDGPALRFVYDGADGIYRGVEVSFDPMPGKAMFHSGRASYDFELAPREQRTIQITVRVAQNRSRDELWTDGHLLRRENCLKHSREQWLSEWTQVNSENGRTNHIVRRCFDDLYTLLCRIDGSEFFAAGVPWFVTLFGRDSLVTAYQCLAFNPKIARETLVLLAKYQGTKDDEWRDEQPGKVLHELRRGELAHLNEIPHTPYYGTADATPLFLMLLASYVDWTNDLELFRSLRPNVDAALGWIARNMAAHPQGYLSYSSPRNNGRGLANQGWKDSGNAIVNPDGSFADSPIALVELQAYVYRAKTDLARVFRAAGDRDLAQSLGDEAQRLRERFERDFWNDELSTYALALQKNGAQVKVATSNPGHALWCGIADEASADKTARRLMREDMFNGWGVRTLSADAFPYNPLGYHLGTVWPHDNAIFVEGLCRYGFNEAANTIFMGLWEAAANFELHRLPELFGGFARDEYKLPVRYPVACHPQAWASGAIPAMLTSLLGLRPDALAGTLRIVRPSWPDRIQSFELLNLRVGQGAVDLRFERIEGRPRVEILEKRGSLRVVWVDEPGHEVILGDL